MMMMMMMMMMMGSGPDDGDHEPDHHLSISMTLGRPDLQK
jgi:hypothetical protein